ncbi:hypothetical protein MFRU_041g00530 [Monilinia fructicola]|nr:hypothetical protein MFRU_041g00530 [Monilinia fructicola]
MNQHGMEFWAFARKGIRTRTSTVILSRAFPDEGRTLMDTCVLRHTLRWDVLEVLTPFQLH